MSIQSIALRGLTALPYTTISFDVLKKESIIAIELAAHDKQDIFLVSQINPRIEEIQEDNLHNYGVLGTIENIARVHSGVLRVNVQCHTRAKLIKVIGLKPYLSVDIENAIAQDDESYEDTLVEAMKRVVRDELREYGLINQNFGREELPALLLVESLNELLYISTATIPWDNSIRQVILNSDSLEERYVYFTQALMKENQIYCIKQDIRKHVKQQMDQTQKEYYLREQMKVIRKELGDDTEEESEVYLERIDSLNISNIYKEKLKKEVLKFRSNIGNIQENNVLRNYLDTVLELPWNEYTTDNIDIKNASRILEEDHYGLEKIKERVLEYLAVRLLNPVGHGPILCLAGPPGTGKTSIARSVAKALERKYIRLSLGGVRDEAEIRGHRRTYVGSMPGRIVDSLRQAKSFNPLILLDEIDKTSGNHKGDLSSALLEVLDGEQNSKFRDHYIEIPVDLSQVLFIATANDIEQIPVPLRDRMEIIEVSSYTENEKFHIAKNYLIKKQILTNGLTMEELEFSDNAIRKLIHNYTREAGVRTLERTISDVCRKCARKKLETSFKRIFIKGSNLEKYLGKSKYNFDMANEVDEVGVVRGLAWTRVGGDTLEIEVNLLPGKGGISLTGRMGDIMKESAKIGLSYIRSIIADYGILEDFFTNHEIHLHIPEGAVPKDGPSAGITMATAIFSALTSQKVRADVAMTGEITLRGRVLGIGGLKEKILAARMAAIKTIIVPIKNAMDVEELSKEITEGLDIRYVQSMREVLDIAIVKE